MVPITAWHLTLAGCAPTPERLPPPPPPEPVAAPEPTIGSPVGRWVQRDELDEYLLFPGGAYVATSADSAATVQVDAEVPDGPGCIIDSVYREDGDWAFADGVLWLAMTRGDTQYPGTAHYDARTGVLTCTGTKMVGSGGRSTFEAAIRRCGETWCFTIGPREYVRVLDFQGMPEAWLEGARRVHPRIQPVEMGGR